MYLLILTDIRTQNMLPVARAATSEKLLELLQQERVANYEDQGPAVQLPTNHPAEASATTFVKYFRKESILEWSVPPTDREDALNRCIALSPSREEWVASAEREWEAKIGNLPAVD